MVNVLEHIANTKGGSTSYVDMSQSAREKRTKVSNRARSRKRGLQDESEGPPDKHDDFEKGV